MSNEFDIKQTETKSENNNTPRQLTRKNKFIELDLSDFIHYEIENGKSILLYRIIAREDFYITPLNSEINIAISKGSHGGYADIDTVFENRCWVESESKVVTSILSQSYISDNCVIEASNISYSNILQYSSIKKSTLHETFVCGSNNVISETYMKNVKIFAETNIKFSQLFNTVLHGKAFIEIGYIVDTISYRELNVHSKDKLRYSNINLIPIYNAIFKSDVVITSPHDYIIFNDFESLKHRFVWTKCNNVVQNEIISCDLDDFLKTVEEEIKPIYQKYIEIIKIVNDTPDFYLYRTREEIDIIKNKCKVQIIWERFLKFLKIK